MSQYVVCLWCGTAMSVSNGEYRRQLAKGRSATHFFCSRSCSCNYGNSLRTDRIREVVKICPVCKKSFTSNTSAKGATFCSRGCASRGSVTEYRRMRARHTGAVTVRSNFTMEVNALGMRNREAWKYDGLRTLLTRMGEPHQFEYPVGKYIFDLALFQRRVLVEFDGPEHVGDRRTRSKDLIKDAEAAKESWTVVRIPVARNTVIPTSVLDDIFTTADLSKLQCGSTVTAPGS